MTSSPYLPAEAWLFILEWATYVPNVFDTHPPDAFAYPASWTEDQIQEGIRQSILTKRRLALVSKQWNVLVTRYLYQAITIRKLSTVYKLLRTFKSVTEEVDATPDAYSSGSPGRWTLRLDVCLTNFASDYEVECQIIAELLHSLPNLEIIVLGGDVSMPFLHNIISTISVSLRPHHLRKLDVSFNQNLSDVLSSYLGLIDAQRELRFLRIKSRFPTSQTKISMPNIEYLDVVRPVLEYALQSADVAPSISHMTIDGSIRTLEEIVLGCLATIGRRLTSLEMVCYTPRSILIQEMDLSSLMHRVAEVCPNLQELIIYLRGRAFTLETEYLPPVKKFGIRWHSSRTLKLVDKLQVKRLCEILVYLVGKTRSIKVVRLLSRPSLQDVGSHSGLLKILQRTSLELMSSYGVRFEDSTGLLFH